MMGACGDIGIKKVCPLASKIYESKIIPQLMKESIFIIIPKQEITSSIATTDQV